ncbi:glycosyltransferase family 4 protein [Diaminobutyricibacter tongyongensis]|uniref:Glycosyltransferase family 4 protein n=1 Tax=Leifsonia tongyongensis TaxID=1268043 RepID=A0A6L9XV35_9MICO|nr:glycosyltransferase family 4 protein [Diaminobutyricibacter tongyongensis]NEN05233.1 glycosyltransferase family 4 protein [Diaminobutyricibacter tongyongensis]
MSGERDPGALPFTVAAPRSRGEVVAVVCDYGLDFVGGAQTAMLSECRSLVAAGARVVLVVPNHAPPAMTAGLHVHALPAFRIPFTGLPLFANGRRLRSRLSSLFRREGVTSVHAHSEFGLAVAGLEVARELGLPSVMTVHTFFWRGPFRWFARPIATLARWFLGALTRQRVGVPTATGDPIGDVLRGVTTNATVLADIVISPSQHQAEALRAAGTSNVRVLPNTVLHPPASLPRPARATIPVTGPLRLLWIGRCAPEKRLIPFVEASVLAFDTLSEGALTVDIVGDGPDLPRARALAARARAIRFHGSVPNADVHDLIRESHVVALTSDGFDNQPMVVVEALREGRGILYVDRRLTEGLDVAGILAPAGPAGMAETIERLCLERDIVVTAGAAARKAFAAFEPDYHATAVLSMYEAARSHLLTRRRAGG